MKEMPFLIIDTETTGLPTRRSPQEIKKGMGEHYSPSDVSKYDSSRVVQIAWVVVSDDMKILADANFTVRPVGFTIPQSDFHNITMADAEKNGRPWSEIAAALQEDMRDATIVGYNLQFDMNVILSELHRHNKMFSKLIKAVQAQPRFCVMNQAREKFGLAKNIKLVQLYYKYFSDTFAAHDALEDVYATIRCFAKLERGIDIKDEIDTARLEFDLANVKLGDKK